MRPTPRAFVYLLTIGVLACGDEDATGTFRLESIGGADLPLVLYEDETSRFVVVSGSLVVTEDSIVERSQFQQQDKMSSAESDLHATITYAYERDGSVLRGIADAPPSDPMFPVCVEVGVFRLEDGGELLRRFDVERDGMCGTPLDPELADMVYRRD